MTTSQLKVFQYIGPFIESSQFLPAETKLQPSGESLLNPTRK